jgi:uncharacterized protein YdhG (YjbR/CyaY superfamily)
VRDAKEEVLRMNKRKQFETIDEYIATYPINIQTLLETLRKAIRLSAPGAEETISYQIPTFRLNGNLVHFAAYKSHIGFYPTSSAVKAFKKELSPFETSKGTVRFPLNKSIPLALVKRIVKFRVKENQQKNLVQK